MVIELISFLVFNLINNYQRMEIHQILWPIGPHLIMLSVLFSYERGIDNVSNIVQW